MLLLAAVLLESERIWLNPLLSVALTPGCSYILLYCVTLSLVKINAPDGGRELSSQSTHHESSKTLWLSFISSPLGGRFPFSLPNSLGLPWKPDTDTCILVFPHIYLPVQRKKRFTLVHIIDLCSRWMQKTRQWYLQSLFFFFWIQIGESQEVQLNTEVSNLELCLYGIKKNTQAFFMLQLLSWLWRYGSSASDSPSVDVVCYGQ